MPAKRNMTRDPQDAKCFAGLLCDMFTLLAVCHLSPLYLITRRCFSLTLRPSRPCPRSWPHDSGLSNRVSLAAGC